MFNVPMMHRGGRFRMCLGGGGVGGGSTRLQGAVQQSRGGGGVSAGAPWPPAAHAVSSGASSSPRTRSRSCAVPSHGGASWEPLHHPWNVRTDSAATEHGFAARRNPGAAARRPARGAGPSRTGAPLGAISEPFVCCSTLRHSRRGSIYWKMRIRLFPLKSFCTAKETIKI